jgi:uncharacterized membrane protein (UPF0127 family)
VRTITIVAIAAAAAAGIIAAAFLFVTPTSRTTELADGQQETAGATPANKGYRQVNVTINNVTVLADIADTNEKRSKGLSVKETLNETEGMLFVFNTSREHSFWMKDMKFPIDIIWISEQNQVVHVEHSLEPCQPDSSCPTYKPHRDSLYVLETVAGFAKKYNVTENSYVDFQLES